MKSMIEELISELLNEMVDEFVEKHKTKNESPKMTKENFRPHIVDRWGEEIYGYIGDKTNLTDVNGNELYVGDTVALYIGTRHFTDTCVVEHPKKKGNFFVSGMFVSDFKNGIWKDDVFNDGTVYRIAKVFSYKNLEHNDTLSKSKLVAKLKYEE